MIVFPNCKINLGLHVTSKRPDGYHNIETIFFPLPLTDALELNTGMRPIFKTLALTLYGADIPGCPDTNLCHKAWQLLQNDFPHIGGARMHLLKSIPIGAGLGGGSSDAAHALVLINSEFQLNLSRAQLAAYALQLGSDCPFFILNRPCFATGRGEILEEVNVVGLEEYYFVLVDPGVHVSTAWAFGRIAIGDRTGKRSLKDVIALPVKQWKHELANDFEEPVFTAHPQLRAIKEELYASGAAYASMSGSGSCIFGIFHSSMDPGPGKIIKQYKVHQLRQNR